MRLQSKQYRHIREDGTPLHKGTWRYAGDFRDGIAVVQGEDGHSTHLRVYGGLLHSAWFRDLDVFHKGWARARDENGWTHVDQEGQPANPRRFAMVEAFYNGQARVELFNGQLEVVNSAGQTVCVLRPAAVGE